MNRWTIPITGIVVVIVLIIVIGGNVYNSVANPDKVSQTTESNKIVDYDNGVYYFPYARAEYAKALSNFIGDHPDLRLVSQTGDPISGQDQGYFVVFEPRVQKE